MNHARLQSYEFVKYYFEDNLNGSSKLRSQIIDINKIESVRYINAVDYGSDMPIVDRVAAVDLIQCWNTLYGGVFLKAAPRDDFHNYYWSDGHNFDDLL